MQNTPVPASAPQREIFPMHVDVKIRTLHTSGPVLANASVDLNGCFVIRGIKVMDSSGGPFISMPSYKDRKPPLYGRRCAAAGCYCVWGCIKRAGCSTCSGFPRGFGNPAHGTVA